MMNKLAKSNNKEDSQANRRMLQHHPQPYIVQQYVNTLIVD